jgi:lysophospholipase L1-like esterase
VGDSTHWVGTWAAAPQLTEPSNEPPPPGLAGGTLRQIVRVSIGGSRLRLRLSNEFGNGPVTMKAVRVALATTGSGIDTASETVVTFFGAGSVTIPSGQAVWSDAFDFSLAPLARAAITIAFGEVPSGICGHPGSRTTSYLVGGHRASDAALTDAVLVEHWYYISGFDAKAPAASRAVVTLGDSITDGRGSTTDGNDRWPDVLAERLQANAETSSVAVVNQGIGGNAVVAGGLGPTASERFPRDVLNQSGARWVIVLEGVNDIGCTNGDISNALIHAYQRFVTEAHASGLLVYGVPILPFGGSQYDSPLHEGVRQTANAWIRTPGRFDAVIDLETIVRDPNAPNRLLPAFDSGDHLHLNAAGLRVMAEAIELEMFTK